MAEKTKTEKDIEDIEFIVDEMIRFGSMDLKSLIDYLRKNKNDAWFYLLNPKDHSRRWFIGEAAQRRFVDLASRHLATSSDLHNDCEISAFTNEVKSEFSSRFLDRGEKELS